MVRVRPCSGTFGRLRGLVLVLLLLDLGPGYAIGG